MTTTAPPTTAPALTAFEPPGAPHRVSETRPVSELAEIVWPHWQRVLFRFFCVYLILQIEPWGFFSQLPGMSLPLRYYEKLVDWAVHAGNARLFHVRETLVPTNGSGDTSWAWAQLWLYLVVAAVACVL